VNNITKNSLVWLRRDLRLYDHNALYQALKKSTAVYCCFIFDTEILNSLNNKNDRRIDFIWNSLREIKTNLNKLGSDLIVEIGDPVFIIPSLIKKYKCDALFLNKDYEQYAINRDNKVAEKLKENKIEFHKYKDQVIYEEKEILTQNESPYTVFTPYKNNYLKKILIEGINQYDCDLYISNLAKFNSETFPTIQEIGFEKSNLLSIRCHLEQKVV